MKRNVQIRILIIVTLPSRRFRIGDQHLSHKEYGKFHGHKFVLIKECDQ